MLKYSSNRPISCQLAPSCRNLIYLFAVFYLSRPASHFKKIFCFFIINPALRSRIVYESTNDVFFEVSTYASMNYIIFISLLTSIKPKNDRTKHDTKKYDEIGARVAKYDSVVRTYCNEYETNCYTHDARRGQPLILCVSLRFLHFSRTERRGLDNQ